MTWQVELAAWCLVLPTPLVRPTHLSFARARLFRTMAHALASFASLRVVAPSVGTAPRSNPGNHKRGLVIVAGKKGAWAKEFDPEYEKANAVVVAEVDVNKWPGLDSTSKERVFEPYLTPEKSASRTNRPTPQRCQQGRLACPDTDTRFLSNDGRNRRRRRNQTVFRSVAKTGKLSSHTSRGHAVTLFRSLVTSSTNSPPFLIRVAFPKPEAKDEDPATYNVLVKKTGRAHVTWNGVGVLQVPRGRDDKESSDVAKTVLLQRIEPLLAEVKRLYPKMNGPFDFVIQKFEDPYAQPVNTTQAVPPGLGLVPAEIVWLKKGKRYPF